MKRIGLLTILISVVISAYGQEKTIERIDSLILDANYSKALEAINRYQSKDNNAQSRIQNKKAEILIAQGKFDEAEGVLNKIDFNKDLFIEAITNTNLGFLYLNKARNDLASDHLKKALMQFSEAKKSASKEAAQCLANLSSLYLTTGKLNQSLETGLLALQLRQQLFNENSEPIAASYNDLGLVYSQTDPDKALDYYEKALSIYEKLHSSNHPKIAFANTNIGMMYLKSKLYGDAVNNFETSEKIWKQIYPNGHPNQAFAVYNLGRTYNQMGDNKAAIAYFEKALAIYKQTVGAKHPSVATVNNQISLFYLDQKKYLQALQYAQNAIIANVPTFNNEDITINPPISEFYNGKVFIYSLQLKAEALEAKYYGRSLKFTDLEFAIATLYKADSLLDIIRHSSDDENDKIAIGAIANDIYEDGVSIAQAMSEMSLYSNRYKKIAYFFSEKSKSAVLQESIADAEAKSFAGIPIELLEQEKKLKADLSITNQKLSQKPTVEQEKELRQVLYLLNQQYESFTKKLEKEFPEYFNLKFKNTNPTIEDVQQRLEKNTALVSYFIAEKKNKLYQFIITPSSFKVNTLSLPENFSRFVTGFSNSLLFNDPTTFHTTALELSKLLVPDLSTSVDDIIFIPSGKLSSTPFEALLTKRTSNTEFNTQPFLIKRYGISYEFSSSLFLQKSKTPSSQKKPSIFLCAPIKFDDAKELDELPGTEQEVTNIAKLFDASATSIVKFEAANEQQIKSKQMNRFSYLHFATHGIVDETSPELSRLFLNSDKTEDGNLFAGEIYNLSLPSELAVLSACQTGLGKVSKGEGVIGLSRALTYSGVKNIIVSFWRVNDQSTSQLMTDFYKHLLAQPTPHFNEALRKAKVAMINSGMYSSPYYWAPFVLIGQ